MRPRFARRSHSTFCPSRRVAGFHQRDTIPSSCKTIIEFRVTETLYFDVL